MKDFIKSKECFASFALALIPSIGFWILDPSRSIPYPCFIISTVLAFLFLWLFLISYLTKNDAKDTHLIKIIELHDDIYLCYKNSLLSQDVFVSLYLQENKFEKLIGYGVVTNVQENGIIQITPTEACKPFTLEELLSQSTSNIIIKPTVTISYLTKKINKREDIPNERT